MADSDTETFMRNRVLEAYKHSSDDSYAGNNDNNSNNPFAQPTQPFNVVDVSNYVISSYYPTTTNNNNKNNSNPNNPFNLVDSQLPTHHLKLPFGASGGGGGGGFFGGAPMVDDNDDGGDNVVDNNNNNNNNDRNSSSRNPFDVDLSGSGSDFSSISSRGGGNNCVRESSSSSSSSSSASPFLAAYNLRDSPKDVDSNKNNTNNSTSISSLPPRPANASPLSFSSSSLSPKDAQVQWEAVLKLVEGICACGASGVGVCGSSCFSLSLYFFLLRNTARFLTTIAHSFFF